MAEGNISSRCFIFPNRRSQVFFTKYLGEAVKRQGTPIVAPKMLTINDFFFLVSGSKPADRVNLLLELYESYTAFNRKAEPLDEFIFWGDVILGDFDDVDKYLADPDKLFTNVSEFKEIQDSYSYLTETQRTAIESFVKHFRSDGKLTVDLKSDSPDVKGRFLQIWNILLPLYKDFRKRLEAKGMAYEGMVYRNLAERMKKESATDVLGPVLKMVDEYVFVGLNALNECEKAVMSKMRNAGIAEFCWDYSSRFIKDKVNKSSFFMSRNVEDFPQSFAIDPEGLPDPDVSVIKVPSSVGQAKLLPAILKSEEYAVVLPDESLLVPVLNSVPSEIKDINVTMGYPMKSSAFFDFLTLVSAMQMHLRQKEGKWYFYHSQVWALFASSIFRRVTEGDEAVKKIVKSVKEGAKYYIPQSELNGHPVLDLIFRPAVSDPKSKSAEQIKALGEYQKTTIKGIASRLTNDSEAAMQLEFAKKAYNAISQLQMKALEIQPVTYFKLLDRLFGPMSVPFNGEPLKGLQVMGPLETRALDFENVIILSCIEGIFPHRSVSSSFIPPELRKGFGLPTYEYQDAVWAYYFYRMIQRAKTVTLVYDSRTEGINTGEESRYIKQLEYHFNLPLNRSFVKAEALLHVEQEEIPKTDEDVEKVRKVTLSASSLKSYLDCPAMFYFSKVAGLAEQASVAEDIDAGILGNVYHSAMQALYLGEGAMDPSYDMSDRRRNENFPGALKTVSKDYLDTWLKRRKDIKARVRSLILSDLHAMEVTGRNLVIENVIVEYVIKTLQRDRAQLDKLGLDSFEVVGLEKFYETEIDGFKFLGFVDRMDSFLPGELRIVDYKTGKVEASDVDITDTNAPDIVEKLFGSDNATRPKIAFQLFLYDMLVGKTPEAKGKVLVNSICQPAKLFTEEIKNVPMSPEFNRLVEERLHGLLAEIVNTEIGWRRTDDAKTCSWCDFKMICGR